MDETVKAVVDSFPDHLSSGDQLGVESVENVLEVFSFPWFFGVKELQKLLNEGRSDVHFQSLDICSVVDDELKEELVDWLEMRPGWVGKGFFLHNQ